MQTHQLSLLDELITAELNITQGLASSVDKSLRTLHNRGIFDFASEMYVTHKVMERYTDILGGCY